MDKFYEFMDQYLDHDRRCEFCNERLWLGYSDGHVWDHCYSCKKNKISNSLNLAGYIGFYNDSNEPVPDRFEAIIYDEGGAGYYRKKVTV